MKDETLTAIPHRETRFTTRHLPFRGQGEGFLQRRTGMIRVQLVNVSSGGFCLWSPVDLTPGEQVSLHLPHTETPVTGTISWCRPGLPGFRFGLETSGANPAFDGYAGQLTRYALWSC